MSSIDISIDFQVTLQSSIYSQTRQLQTTPTVSFYLHMYTTPTCLTARNEWMHNRKPKLKAKFEYHKR